MSETVAAFMLNRLHEWGVKRIYGYPGDGINGLLGAFHEVTDVEFLQCRHEEIAAFDAKLDHQPVVAIVGQQKTMAIGSNFQQEIDLVSLFKDVAHEFVQVCMAPEQAKHLIDRAMRIAQATRSVTCVIVPDDIQEEPYSEPPRQHGAVFSSPGYKAPRVVPADDDVKQAADVLGAGKKVAILVGQGAAGAEAELEQVADLLGAGVAKALNGRYVLPDDLPYVTGPIGLLGSKPSYEMMAGCDTLLMVGSSFPYSEFLPKEGQARGVQIDIKGRMLGLRYPMEVNLVGDSAETLRALLPHLKRKQGRSWRQKIEQGVREWRKLLEERAQVEAKPLNPAYVFHELNARLPDRAIFSADSGSSATWYARHLDFRKGMMGSLSGNLATMGPALPYAVAAKFAYPDRPVFALAGDGAIH